LIGQFFGSQSDIRTAKTNETADKPFLEVQLILGSDQLLAS
jgi:hypothetical protein